MSVPAGLLAGLAGMLSAAGLAFAQGGPPTIQFSFSNPGARSLGMGGAFAALADDATAAFANPAGLVQLTRPEVSLEGRYWSFTTPYTQGGRVSGAPTGNGLDTPLRFSESEYDTAALSFLSFVYPSRSWTVSLSRHQLAKFRVETETQGLFTDDTEDDPQPTCLPGTDLCRYPDFRRAIDTEIVGTAASVAYRLSDAFSIGIGLSYFQGDMDWVSDGYEVPNETPAGGFFGPNSYPQDGRVGSQFIAGDDSDWQASAGFLWFITRQWSLGGFFRGGPAFVMSGAIVSGPALDPPVPVGTVALSEPKVPITFPDVYGLGLTYRSPAGTWTASFEWDRVEYSTIVESIPESDFISTRFVTFDDADELRVGVEYLFLEAKPMVALRAGVWKDPDHLLRSFEDDPLERALLRGGSDEIHYALGAGVALESFQADLAIDVSDLVSTASLSLIYAF